MRYFWALLAYVTAIVVAAASCGGGGNSNGFTQGGSGGQTGTGGVTGSSNSGGGGSSGVGITFTDSGSPVPEGGVCPAYLGDCAAQKLNCGMATDGCGNTLDCGTCTNPNETCGGGGTQNVCGAPICNAQTCASQGFDCGMATDGCGNTIDCGSCQNGDVCGAKSPNVCGSNGVCTPTTCAANGWNCGMQSDGCGMLLDCGTCAANEICGYGGVTGVCGAPVCVPKDCASQGFNCGAATDGCGNVIQCGTCGSGQICGAAMPNVCGTTVACTGLCQQQMQCTGGGTTSVSGTVYAPNGKDPLPNTLVYVPNGGAAPTYGVQPFNDGVATPHCDCGSDVTGSPLVSAVTDYKGQFTITNMPVGANIPIVIQNGRWRRKMTIPNVGACTNTALPTSGAQQLRMPKVEHETDPADNIPKMGFVTGAVDALECVLRKIGIADSQFSDPSGTGRVRFYLGDTANGPGFFNGPGAYYSGSTPDESQLWGTQSSIDAYDMVFFACKGDEYDRTPASEQTLVNYTNAGGRVFTTHYGYVWLFDNTYTPAPATASFQSTATWNANGPVNFVGPNGDGPETGYIDTTFPKGQLLAQWLQYIGASTTYGQMQINTLRNDFSAINSAISQLWVSVNDPSYPPNKPMHYTFNTPVGAPAAQQCGRVLYDDFHVEDAFTQGVQFPQECTVTGMTPQEKMLEFMIFDLGSCVTPPTCTPKTCAQMGATCGPVGDGCGNIIQCGACPSGQACVAGQCMGNGCTPKTCQQQSYKCGMQGDGCGNAIDCGTCPSGQTCGSGGQVGQCGSGTCTPTTCAAKGYMCGSIGDGCGNVINCGVCPSGQICGGQTPGQCYTPPCTPKTCAQLGYTCGNASDGCNNTINCGTCSGTQTCGGGGTPNVCGGGAG